MHDPLPSCFRGGAAAGAPPSSTASGPNLTTSVYDTHLGLAALTWSRTVLGLSVRAEIRLGGGGGGGGDKEEDSEDEPLRFRIRPWLFWKRRGSRRFQVRERQIDFVWDLTRSKFRSGGGPEPSGGYFLAVAIDGEILLIAGDLVEDAFKRLKTRRSGSELLGPPACLISRRDHVVMGDDRSYKTRARFGGKEREISIDLGGEMSLRVDGERILQVRRLRWKFRGSERVEVEGGDRIQVSWDLHNWLFQAKEEVVVGNAPELGNAAVFVFRFERGGDAEGHYGKKGYFGKEEEGVFRIGGYFGKNRNWSESSSGGGGGGNNNSSSNNNNSKAKKKKKSLLKTSSSSSSASSASSAGSSTVMEWASAEETELRCKDGFSLLVYAWKS